MLVIIPIIACRLEIHDKAILLAAINNDFLLPAAKQADIYLETAKAVMFDQFIQKVEQTGFDRSFCWQHKIIKELIGFG